MNWHLCSKITDHSFKKRFTTQEPLTLNSYDISLKI